MHCLSNAVRKIRVPGTFQPDRGLLALIEQAYADPSRGRGEIAAYCRRNGRLRGGDMDASYTTFIVRTLFARLGIRCQLLPSSAQRSLGLPKVRDALVDVIRSAFPAEPLVGNSLGEVLLQADYQSAVELYSRARASPRGRSIFPNSWWHGRWIRGVP